MLNNNLGTSLIAFALVVTALPAAAAVPGVLTVPAHAGPVASAEGFS